MAEEAPTKPVVDPTVHSETLTDGLRWGACSKYLRPPVWISCDRGHNASNACRYTQLPIIRDML